MSESVSFFSRLSGVRTPHRKDTADMQAVVMPAPATVLVPMSMNIGAPAVPCVGVGDHVDVGQVIAQPGGFVSAPIHAGVSGTVKQIEDFMMTNGRTCQAIRIESDGLQTMSPDIKPPVITDILSLLDAVRASGAVGLGGAGFPTAVKFSIGDKPLHAIIINGAECEPYITSDTRTLLDRQEDMFYALEILKEHLHPERIVFGIEKNKPQAIASLRGSAPAYAEIKALPSIYPQGGEKVLIYHTTGRTVQEGKLPIDAGAIVLNCTTLAFLGQYFKTGCPLVSKCITVAGAAVARPQNVIVPIGTPIKDVFDFCGGFREGHPPVKVLYGGPMMGIAVPDLNVPVLKNTNAILAMDEKESAIPEFTQCIRCGKCLLHCPLGLEPRSINAAYEHKDMQALQKLHAGLCMECGCCSYICPARRPLTQLNKLAKAELIAWQKQQKEGK
ncbi:MAG: electron transport complex subunit RsxC [Clostridia bacterium]|nr:electron transport complex subunit RsxC [Clostridia bacterium]